LNAIVIVPTYNEAASLGRVVEGILVADPGLDVLVVDDASPDGTGDLAEQLAGRDGRVHVLHRAAKAGLGSAYRAGFAWALRRGHEAICQMDADGSHDPADLPRLLAALAAADFALGSRYVPGGEVATWPRRRLWLSTAANRYVRIATGVPVADATSGFRAFRRTALTAIAPTSMRSEGYAFQVETALRAWQAGFGLTELPITFVERQEGRSKLSRAIVLEALWRGAGWGLRGRLRRAPRRG
jgi:glycosyltransferase involved in cell wall biosynthesis